MTNNEPQSRCPTYDRADERDCGNPFQLCNPTPHSDYCDYVVLYGLCPFLSVKRMDASVRRGYYYISGARNFHAYLIIRALPFR